MFVCAPPPATPEGIPRLLDGSGAEDLLTPAPGWRWGLDTGVRCFAERPHWLLVALMAVPVVLLLVLIWPAVIAQQQGQLARRQRGKDAVAKGGLVTAGSSSLAGSGGNGQSSGAEFVPLPRSFRGTWILSRYWLNLHVLLQ